MNIGGIIGGTIAAIIGIVVWAAVAYYANVEIAYLAWGIGLLVGLGVSAGSRSGGIGAAVIAVVLTVLSLLGGKYAAIQLAVRDLDNEIPEFVMTDEDVTIRLTNEHIEEVEAAGQQVEYRNGKSYDTVESLADYPAASVAIAEEQFAAMSEAERTAKIEEAERDYDEAIAIYQGFKSNMVNDAFMNSFGLLDIVFFLLGIFTAGKVALSDVIDS